MPLDAEPITDLGRALRRLEAVLEQFDDDEAWEAFGRLIDALLFNGIEDP